MAAFLEVWTVEGRQLLPLVEGRVTVGREADNDLAVVDDPTLSRLHAVIELLGSGWCVRDLASANGTFVNGERIWAERPLRPGDEIRAGRTRMLFRATGGEVTPVTETAQPAPVLTPRERDVLVALCRPVLAADVFTEPASIRQIAERLTVSEAAVKQHLARLYDKFEVHEVGERRRVRLANEAVRRGAVSLSDLRG